MTATHTNTNYELRHFRSGKLNKMMRFFHTTSPRTRIVKYPSEMFLSTLRADFTGKTHEYCVMADVINQDYAMNGLLYEDEDITQFTPILIMIELKEETPWIKGCLYNHSEDTYYLRSIHQEQHVGDYRTAIGTKRKQLKKSKIDGWFIDDSTLSADYSFWKSLKRILIA